MLSIFGFGKKRRSRRRSTKTSRKGGRKGSKKPPAKLLRICKKLRVSVMVKRGSKKSYKKVSVLKRSCMKKLRALKKKHMKKSRKVGRKSYRKKRTTRHRKSYRKKRTTRRRFGSKRLAFGSSCNAMKNMEFGRRRSTYGRMSKSKMYSSKMSKMSTMNKRYMMFCKGRHRSTYGRMSKPKMYSSKMSKMSTMNKRDMMFGKGRRTRSRKVSKAAAMKAFKKFYMRHCRASGRSRFGRLSFGSGGNPPLYQSMGSEFCSDGKGGVLGSTSTGLFATPCAANAYGRRYRRKSRVGRRKSAKNMEFGRRRRRYKSKSRKVVRRRRKTTRRSRRVVRRKSMVGRRMY